MSRARFAAGFERRWLALLVAALAASLCSCVTFPFGAFAPSLFAPLAAFSLTACRFARVSARAALAFAVLLTARLADRFVPVPVAS